MAWRVARSHAFRERRRTTVRSFVVTCGGDGVIGGQAAALAIDVPFVCGAFSRRFLRSNATDTSDTRFFNFFKFVRTWRYTCTVAMRGV